jgi:S1-C subfamily serine protease
MPRCLALIMLVLAHGLVVPALTAQGEAQGFLGVKLENHYITDGSVLVRVSEVIANGPAEKAGLKAGDVILTVANVEAKDREVVIETIKNFKPGDRITIIISRNDKEISFCALLAKREEP